MRTRSAVVQIDEDDSVRCAGETRLGPEGVRGDDEQLPEERMERSERCADLAAPDRIQAGNGAGNELDAGRSIARLGRLAGARSRPGQPEQRSRVRFGHERERERAAGWVVAVQCRRYFDARALDRKRAGSVVPLLVVESFGAPGSQS